WLVAIVRIFVASRRPCDSEALATSSYGTYFAQPLSAATFVMAAVNVVLPWSMCPIVPTFKCGLFRSNFCLAIVVVLWLWLCGGGRTRTGDTSIMSRVLLPSELRRQAAARRWRALCGNRTHDTSLTMAVLCRLS